MLINKITAFSLTNDNRTKNFTRQSPTFKSSEADVFVKSTDTTQGVSETEIYEVIDTLRSDPNHPERANLSNKQLLYEIAMMDVLTGLRNRRALYVDLKKDIETAKKQRTGISIAMFDMDNFKSINDLFDHDKGDEFLKVIGSEIGQVASENNCKAYRYGGEEFIITMPGVDSDAAKNIAEKVRKNINQNSKLQANYESYITKAQNKMNDLQAIQEPFIDFKRYLAEHKIREADFMVYAKREDAIPATKDFLRLKTADSMKKIQEKFLKLLEHAKRIAPSESEKRYLSNKIASFRLGGEISVEYDKDLKTYLNTRLNKEFEISQIATWINHVKKLVDGKPQGFTITAGIREFKDLNPDVEDPVKYFIEQTDKVLIRGKNEDRGRVYTV